jgi:hypothetical protein
MSVLEYSHWKGQITSLPISQIFLDFSLPTRYKPLITQWVVDLLSRL